MKVKITTDHYLINFKYPWIERYSCYECPGAHHIVWREVHFIKTGSTTKSHTLTPIEESLVRANKAMEKSIDGWQKRLKDNESYWSN